MSAPHLIIMRHAKTEAQTDTGRDADRALTSRGTSDALLMGRWLRAHWPAIDRIVASPARRTRETVAGVVGAWGEEAPPVVYEPTLYLAELPTLLTLVGSHRAETALLVGHNPGLEELVRYLVPDLLERVTQPKLMPTGAVYVLRLPTGRGAPAPVSAHLLEHMRPKFLSGI